MRKLNYFAWFMLPMLLLPLSVTVQAQTTVNFTVVQPPPASAGFKSSIQGDRVTFLFTDSSLIDIVERRWYFGDGDSAVGNDLFQTHTYPALGIYNACLRVTDTNGCTDEFCKEVSSFVGINENAFDIDKFTVSPNPFQGTATIRYQLPERSDVLLELYDIVGAKIRTLVSSSQSAGAQSFSISSLSGEGYSGMYIVRLTIKGNTYLRKIVETN